MWGESTDRGVEGKTVEKRKESGKNQTGGKVSANVEKGPPGGLAGDGRLPRNQLILKIKKWGTKKTSKKRGARNLQKNSKKQGRQEIA